MTGMGDISTSAVADVVTPLLYNATKGVTDFFNSLVYSGYPAPPSPAPPPGPSTSAQETVPGAFTPDQAIAAGAAANQQTYQDFFGTVADTNAASNAGLGFWILVALGFGALAIADVAKGR